MALGACEETRTARPIATPSPSPRPSETRVATEPRSSRPRLVIEATGPARDRLVAAVRDLRAVDLWARLAGDLYVIELDSRLGRANVPEDGHLADAYFTGIVDASGGGTVCDVMFFPTAIADDLARWRDYYSVGATAAPPPSLRAFYGSLVAHELAHCRKGPRGEAVARAWEERARDALVDSGF